MIDFFKKVNEYTDVKEITRFISISKKIPMVECQKLSIANKHIIVIEDGLDGNITKYLVRRLEEQKCKVAILTQGKISYGDYSTYIADFMNVDEIEAQVIEIHKDLSNVHGVINLSTIATTCDFMNLTPKEYENELMMVFNLSFIVAKEVYEDLKQDGSFCVCAGNLVGVYATETVVDGNVWFGLNTGFYKSLKREIVQLQCKIIDFDDCEDYEFVTEKIIDEMTSLDYYIEVGYCNKIRKTVLVVPEELSEEESTMRTILTKDDVILFSGGGRGIIYEMVKGLLSVSEASIIITGRTKPPIGDEDFILMSEEEFEEYKPKFMMQQRRINPSWSVLELANQYEALKNMRQLNSNLKELKQYKDRIRYIPCDFANYEEVKKLAECLKKKYIQVTGIVNGSGIPSLGKIDHKKLSQGHEVIRTKALSFYNIYNFFKDEPLKFFNNIGSISGRFGMDGEADYCAVSDLVSKMTAILRKKCSYRLFTVAWSAWEKVGMAMHPSVEKTHLSRGLHYINVAEGVHMFLLELAYGTDINEMSYFGGIGKDYLASIIVRYIDIENHKLRIQYDEDGYTFNRAKYPYLERIINDSNTFMEAAGTINSYENPMLVHEKTTYGFNELQQIEIYLEMEDMFKELHNIEMNQPLAIKEIKCFNPIILTNQQVEFISKFSYQEQEGHCGKIYTLVMGQEQQKILSQATWSENLDAISKHLMKEGNNYSIAIDVNEMDLFPIALMLKDAISKEISSLRTSEDNAEFLVTLTGGFEHQMFRSLPYVNSLLPTSFLLEIQCILMVCYRKKYNSIGKIASIKDVVRWKKIRSNEQYYIEIMFKSVVNSNNIAHIAVGDENKEVLLQFSVVITED